MILQRKISLIGVLLLVVSTQATPPPGHVPTPDNDKHPPKYEYGYIVSDEAGSQGHVESRDGIFALGRYHVTLPDGSAQKVTYFADDWGYHPLVSYGSSTDHGASSTHFAMGDQAVAALHKTGSPAANLISSSKPTFPVVSTNGQVEQITNVVSSPPQVQIINSPQETQVIGNHPQVQISNVGASGHQDQTFKSEVTTVSYEEHSSQAPITLSTTLEPPAVTPQENPAQSTNFISQENQSSASHQTDTSSTAVTTGYLPPESDNGSQQQHEAHQIQQELQEQIQQTVEKLEQEAKQNIQQQVIQKQANEEIRKGNEQQKIQNQVRTNDENEIRQQDLGIQQPILQHQQLQNLHQQIQHQLFQHQQHDLQQQVVVASQAPSQQPLTYTIHQQYSQSITPVQQYLTPQAQSVVSVSPTQQYIQRPQQSVFGSVYVQQTPTAMSNNIQIVTPTSALYQRPYSVLSENSLNSKQNEDETPFTVEGQNVQITSYLADTNKALQFGDRIQARERQAEQNLINEIEKHAKLRIYQDLQKNSISNSLKPIIVTGGPSPVTEANVIAPGSSSASLLNIATYNSVSSTPVPPLGPQSPTDLPLINHSYLASNSLSAEKSDHAQTSFGTTSINYSSRPYATVDQLAPLQAGLTLFSAPEKPAAPVSEESKEDYQTVVDVQKGLTFDIPHSSNQIEVGQFQALGYERRLVDSRAQQVVNEPNPAIQAIKSEDLVVRQEQELRQVQENIQDLQSKIIKEIDAQHEEEQRKQEVVANERQKHLDSLKKVAELLQEKGAPSNPGNVYQGPEYLPPLPDTVAPFKTQSYQNVDTTSSGQDVQIKVGGEIYQGPEYLPPVAETPQATLQSHQNIALTSTSPNIHIKAEDNNLAPPPVPPTTIEVEKPVFIEKPVAIESTKVVEVEKPVLIKETVPIETTKVVEVEKAVPVYQSYPVTVTRVVTIDRPVAVPTPYGVPQPVPLPYAVPHPVEVPVPHLVPYPELYPITFKQYHPVFIHGKPLKDLKPSKRMPEQVFKEPKPELFQHSYSYRTIPLNTKIYPHKSSYYRQHYKSHHTASGRNRNALKNLRIEYGGFKPPLVPSAEFSEEPKPSLYGPSVKE